MDVELDINESKSNQLNLDNNGNVKIPDSSCSGTCRERTIQTCKYIVHQKKHECLNDSSQVIRICLVLSCPVPPAWIPDDVTVMLS